VNVDDALDVIEYGIYEDRVEAAKVLRAALDRVREMHQGGHECPSPEDNCGWWPVGDCPTIRALDGPS
jgi:hypothetical protein